jgi:hypothetical protein
MQMMKFIGKPYAGKPHVRIDEGAGEAFCLLALLYCSKDVIGVNPFNQCHLVRHEACV